MSNYEYLSLETLVLRLSKTGNGCFAWRQDAEGRFQLWHCSDMYGDQLVKSASGFKTFKGFRDNLKGLCETLEEE